MGKINKELFFMYLNHQAKHTHCCHIHFIFWVICRLALHLFWAYNFTFIILVTDTLMVFLILNNVRFRELGAHYISCFGKIRKCISKSAPPKLPLVKC